jgi:hypothetical protein
MSKNIIKCPKCRSSKLLLTEVAELRTQYLYENGYLTTSKNEEISDIKKYEASCGNDQCNHKWTLKKDIFLGDIPMADNKKGIIEFTCITCGLLKKIKPTIDSTFNPKTDECIECKLGITEL